MEPTMISPDEIRRLKGLGFLVNKNSGRFSARVVTGYGLLDTRQLRLLQDAADRFGDGQVVLTTRLSVEIPGIPYEKTEELRAFLAGSGLETGGTGKKVRPIVCCKGTTCQHGLLDSYAVAAEMHERFYRGYHDVTLPHKFKIAVGGCPNSCVKPNLNDVGVTGWRGGYRITLGGRWGRQQTVGRPMDRIVPEKEEMMDIVEKAILLFRDLGRDGERFCATVERLGFGRVQALLLADDLLLRKQEILRAAIRPASGDTPIT